MSITCIHLNECMDMYSYSVILHLEGLICAYQMSKKMYLSEVIENRMVADCDNSVTLGNLLSRASTLQGPSISCWTTSLVNLGRFKFKAPFSFIGLIFSSPMSLAYMVHLHTLMSCCWVSLIVMNIGIFSISPI
jgi:hypothetical protein